MKKKFLYDGYADPTGKSPCKEPILVENGEYAGRKYYIIDRRMFPTAYVECPDFSEDTMYSIDVPVHGGITFCQPLFTNGANYVGWDYCHTGDFTAIGLKTMLQMRGKKWTYKEVLQEIHNCIDFLNLIKEK